MLSGTAIVTTEVVLGEFLTFYAADAWLRTRAAATVRSLLSDPSVLVSMQVMRREGLTAVLTNDRHFEQEGFRILFQSTCSPIK
ncbi:MAG: hypothetical protein HY820_42070 [Acidobacteria bacterium]|nr:hypothetical protein [Acidobacteriota bacterium]